MPKSKKKLKSTTKTDDRPITLTTGNKNTIGHFKSSNLTKNNCQQKRKIPERPTENEWIGPLTEEYKEMVFFTKKELCSDIMNHVQTILKKDFADIQRLQAT